MKRFLRLFVKYPIMWLLIVMELMVIGLAIGEILRGQLVWGIVVFLFYSLVVGGMVVVIFHAVWETLGKKDKSSNNRNHKSK